MKRSFIIAALMLGIYGAVRSDQWPEYGYNNCVCYHYTGMGVPEVMPNSYCGPLPAGCGGGGGNTRPKPFEH